MSTITLDDPVTPDQIDEAMEYLLLTTMELASVLEVDRVTIWRWRAGERKMTGPPRVLLQNMIDSKDREAKRLNP